MILSILAIILVAAIAYFHWVQGLFSAAISMALAILASTLAIGMHESLATSLLGGAMADYANALMTGAIFAAVYGIGRILFDMLVPGNVAIPFYMDKVGAGFCGLIAGIFAVGTIVLASQMLPFGVSVAGFSRYAVAETKQVTIPTQRRAADAEVSGALDVEAAQRMPAETARKGLIFGFDSMVLNFATFQSESGAMAGDVNLIARHPDLLGELFFGRVGIEAGAKHTALNIAGKKDISVTKVLTAPSLIQMDAELKQIRHPNFTVEKQLKAGPNDIILVVRTHVSANASDKDKHFRVGIGAVRLVAGGKDIYPVGTLYHPGNILLANRIDDYLIVNAASDAEVDFVFYVDRAAVLEDPAAKDGYKIKSNSFVEVKRYARVDLSGMEIVAALDSPSTDTVLRKTGVTEEITKRLSGAVEEGTK